MNEYPLTTQRIDPLPPFGRHRKLYWLVFAVMIVLTLGNQLITQDSIQKKMYDEHVVNLAGRQRTLSQMIVKTAYRALMTRNQNDIVALKNLTNLWNNVHWGLQRGSNQMNLPPLENDGVRKLFEQLQPHQTALYEAVNQTKQVNDLRVRIETIDAQGQDFLRIMDRIVSAFETEARQKLIWLMYLELMLATVTIVVLVVEIFFVFRPFYRKIISQNQQLREIAYIQSHEVRRPVCSILGLMQLIQGEEEPAARAQYVEMLRISTEELERATRQIMERANEKPKYFAEKTLIKDLLREVALSKAASSKAASSAAASKMH